MSFVHYLVYLFPIATALALFGFFYWYWDTQRAPLARRLIQPPPQGEPPEPAPRFTFAGKCHPMVRRDAIPVLLITAVYAVTAFFHLGSLQAPQSAWDFGDGEAAVFSLPQEAQVSKLWYYPNLGTGKYQVEISADGVEWLTLWTRTETAEGSGTEETVYYWADSTGYGESYAMTQNYNQLFKWNEIVFENPQYVRYLRITGQANKGLLELGEVALFDMAGNRVDLSGSANPLFDEQETVPAKSTYYDSAYFDEIYHPRTAWEHVRGIEPYEVSHPPLGKLIMGVGIRLFGMTPFGWRFMGTLFGVGMLPLLYIFLKNLFGRTSIATCGTILLAADFMHLTQTRLATIDTYAFFFILLMYWFMYRYLTLPAGTPFRRCALPLVLSGLFWGIGAASKWTVIYGCTGLVVLYFIGLYQKVRDWPAEQPGRVKWTVQILAFSVLVFAAIPAAIYTLSYLPYAQAEGDASLTGLLSAMWENQKYMLSYHSGVTDSHPYSSRWYQWILDIRPILYFMDNDVPGYTTRFAAFVNPVVCWGGLLAVIACAAQAFRRFAAKLAFFLATGLGAAASALWVNGVFDGETELQTRLLCLLVTAAGLMLYLALGCFAGRSFQRHSPIALFIVIGYLAQLAPWFLIGRITFAYHYFPSVLFLVLALCYVFSTLAEREEMISWKPAMYAVTGGAVGLYALFYPVLVGIQIPTWFSNNVLGWIPSWPL